MNNFSFIYLKSEEILRNDTLRIGIIVLVMLLFSISSNAQTRRFTITVNNTNVETVLQKVRDQSDLNFIYSNEEVQKCPPISLSIYKGTLTEIFDACFENTGLTYKIVNNTVVITPRGNDTGKLKKKGSSLTQIVRGIILDEDSRTPLIGATIQIMGTHPPIGTITNVKGEFRLEKIPVGRIDLRLSYVGFQKKVIPNIVVNSAKEVVLHLSMQESVTEMQEVVVTFDDSKGRAINDMSIVSSRSISPEESNRYAGPFNDPTRIMSYYAGVANTQDGSNDIIVRGNSPKYVQWKLEGVQITNPSHFADQNGLSTGGISVLNNNLLATSDFHTGAFTAEFGDVISGVYDVKLRTGNNEKLEGIFGIGIMGTDITLEGPLKKGYNGSFLANYRYSTVGLISDLGLVDVTGIPTYQDAAFKLALPTKNFGTFSFFGLGGLSKFYLEDLTAADASLTPGDSPITVDVKTDHKSNTHLLNVGMDYIVSLNKNGYLNASMVYSQDGIEDDVYEITETNGNEPDENQLFDSKLNKKTYRGSIRYHHKFNPKNKLSFGSNYSLFHYDYYQTQYDQISETNRVLLDFNEKVGTLRNHISWKFNANNKLTFITGLHNMNVLFNNKSTLEPRIAMRWKLNANNTLSAGFGKHSSMETIHNYFAKIDQEDGSILEPNRGLDLLKANHYVIGYEKRFSENLVGKIEFYYQDLYNLPVENNDTSIYATINETYEINYVDLVNKGVGKNYGVELSIERFFHNHFYFLINTSIFESKYTPLDGIERNTRFNNNFIFNVLAGKEFINLGKRDNQVLGLNAKIFFGGGQKYIPFLRDGQGNVNGQYMDNNRAYQSSLENLYYITFSASYKWNKPKTTHELWLSLDNLTDTRGKLYEYYDPSQPNNIGYNTQFGFFPNLMYRIYF